MNELSQAQPLPAKSPKRYFQTATQKLYTARQICDLFQIARRTFFHWKRDGKLPLIEVRVGRTVRYQAAPIDRMLAGGR